MWFFYTVILGMAFGRVLQELAVTVRDWRHGTRRPFAPAVLWQAFLLASIVQVWLAVRYAVHTEEISVLGLLAFLAVPSGILVMSFLLPQSDLDPQHDPEAAFGRVRPVFFGVLIGTVAINLVHSFVIGQRGLDFDLLFQCLLAAGGLTGLLLRRTRADITLAAVMTLIVCVYIGLGYSTVEVGGPGARRRWLRPGRLSPPRHVEAVRHGVGQRLRDVDAGAAAGRRRPQRGVDARRVGRPAPGAGRWCARRTGPPRSTALRRSAPPVRSPRNRHPDRSTRADPPRRAPRG